VVGRKIGLERVKIFGNNVVRTSNFAMAHVSVEENSLFFLGLDVTQIVTTL
jgi:beta-galactosidase GanA